MLLDEVGKIVFFHTTCSAVLDWQNKKMWSLRRAYSEGLFAGEGVYSQIHV